MDCTRRLKYLALVICTGLLSITRAQAILPSYALVQDTTHAADTTHRVPKHIKISKDGLDDDLTYDSDDTTIYDIAGQKMLLRKNAYVKYQDIELKAYYIELDYATGLVTARPKSDSALKESDKPSFKQGQEEFNAGIIQFNFKTKKGLVSNIVTEQGEGYIHGNTVKVNEKKESFGRDMLYTTCNYIDHPDFYIKATKMKVIPNKLIVSGPAQLYIEDVPTPLVVPFGIFPISKGQKSGLIIPTYGESQALGYYLQNGGYYFGLGDKMDLAVRGSIYSQGSWGLNLASNYDQRYEYNGTVSLSYDRFRNGDPIDPTTFSVQNNYRILWNHSQDPKANPGHTFSVSINAGSSSYDKIYNPDLTAKLNNTLNSSINYSKRFDWAVPVNLSLSSTYSQDLSTHAVNLSAPSLNIYTDRINFFQKKDSPSKNKWYEKIGTTITLRAQNEINFYDTMPVNRHLLNQFQNGMQITAPLSTSFQVLKYVTISPSITDDIYGYLNSIRETLINKTIKADTLGKPSLAYDYTIGISASTRIYGIKQFKKGYIRAIRHVMTPTIGLSYKPDFSQDKYGFYRTVHDSNGVANRYSIYQNGIYGGPSAGKFGGLNFSLGNNLEMKKYSATDTVTHTKKVKLIDNFLISSGYNMAADSLQWQPVQISASTTFFNKLNISSSANWSFYDINSAGAIYNKFYSEDHSGPLRLNNILFTAGTSFSSDDFLSADTKKEKAARDKARKAMVSDPDAYVDFYAPWHLGLNYALNLIRTKSTATGKDTTEITNTFNFNGDVNLTDHWKVGFTSGWDFTRHTVAPTQFNIYRDLHCWEMRFTWVPFGTYRSYSFTINARASLLQDLKYTRRKDYYDY